MPYTNCNQPDINDNNNLIFGIAVVSTYDISTIPVWHYCYVMYHVFLIVENQAIKYFLTFMFKIFLI